MNIVQQSIESRLRPLKRNIAQYVPASLSMLVNHSIFSLEMLFYLVNRISCGLEKVYEYAHHH